MAVVLIVGAAGFIGSHLSKRHLERGDTVIGLDNLATGNVRNISDISHSNWTFHEDDLLTATLPTRVDKIYHFASPASPPKYMELAWETMAVNTTGTKRLIDLSAETGARMLFASTSEVYGDPLVHPQSEGYWGNVNPIGPRSVYDEAKRFGETLMSHAFSSGYADASLIRIFNTYGPNMDPWDGRVVSTFIRQALVNEPLSVFGDGSQTRSFCYIDDLVNGILAVMDSGVSGPINLGNPNEFTLIELAQVVQDEIGVTLPLQHFELPTDDPKQRKPNINLAKEQLGWAPEIELHEGVRRTAAWMREVLS